MNDEKTVSVNGQNIAHDKWKFQQASSAVEDKLQKTLHATMDPGNCGGSENLIFIQLGEEYERLL
jgi:hypothetical protein